MTRLHETELSVSPARLPAGGLGDQVVVWSGIGRDGYELVRDIRGESRHPAMIYRDGDLTLISRDAAPTDGDQVVVLRGVRSDEFERLRQLPESPISPRLLYLDGDLFLMAPSQIHELWVDRLGSFVREILIELDIPSIPTRETLFRQAGGGSGVQPDDSFYIAHWDAIAAKGRRDDIDLRVDPPPDLAIEFVHTHDATEAIETLRRLGVPEVWVADRDGLRFLVRDEIGQYRETERSLAFPFLTAPEVFGWVARTDLMLLPEWSRALRRWIAEVLAPRIG